MTSKTTVGIAVVCAALMFVATRPLAAQTPCSDCGPGDHWVDTCAAGTDVFSSTGAVIGIDTDLDIDCTQDVSLVLRGPTTIQRSAGVPHSIQTEIVSMSLTGGGVTLTAGAGLGQGGVLQQTLGTIVEKAPPDVELADSMFDVWFEVDMGEGQFLYNHAPLVTAAVIDCVPPAAQYIHPTGCLDLYDAPPGMGGIVVARLVSAVHETFPPPSPIPTVSEWGVIIMTLIGLTAGTIVFGRRRRRAAA